MTTEIEKTFFDTFGIEPSGKKCTCNVRDFAKCNTYYCTSCEKALVKVYPQITDRILLELICIISEYKANDYENWFISCNSIEELKRLILEQLIYEARFNWIGFKHQVCTLFEEGE